SAGWGMREWRQVDVRGRQRARDGRLAGHDVEHRGRREFLGQHRVAAGGQGKGTSVVSDPNVDPHSYQSSAGNARAFAEADYVVLNGAGYDAWADKLLSGNPNAKRKVFTVAALLGKREGA